MEPAKIQQHGKGGKEISAGELQYRVDYDKKGATIKPIPLCAICRRTLLSNIALNRDVYAHPQLDVLMCKECYDRQIHSDFSAKQLCAFCGLVGILKSCKKCPYYFCMRCLEMNLEQDIYEQIKTGKWECLICSPEPIWEQRAMCSNLLESVMSSRLRANRKRLRTVSTDNPTTTSVKRKRSTSLGSESYTNIELLGTVSKLPSEENFSNVETQLLDKADELSLLMESVNGRLTKFKDKIKSRNFSSKMVQKVFTFESELIDTTIKTLDLWKGQLDVMNKKWQKDFGVDLYLPKDLQPLQDQNCAAVRSQAKRRKSKLSLRKTFDTQLTDEEFDRDLSLMSVPAPDDTNCSAATCNPEVPNEVSIAERADSSLALDSNSKEILNKEDSDNESIFSAETVLIDQDNYMLWSDEEMDALVKTDDEFDEELMLCELSGCFISSQNVTRIDDDCASDSSFVFDLGGYVSESSPKNDTNTQDDTDQQTINQRGSEKTIPSRSFGIAEEEPQDDENNSAKITVKEEEKVAEDLEAKIEFFKSLELGSKNEVPIDMDVKESIEDDVRQALKLLQDDDSDFLESDMSASISNTEEESEYEKQIEDPSESDRGTILHQMPALPSKDCTNSPVEKLVINATSNSDDDLETNLKYGIKPCSVIIERLTFSLDKVEQPKKSSNKDELKEIERLTNLDNLDAARKNVEPTSKKQKRRKIVKSSGSSGSNSESHDSDSDCSSVIPSSLHANDTNDTIMHNMSLITPDDMLDHLLNGNFCESELDASGEDSDADKEANDKARKKKVKRTGSTDSNKENEPVKQEVDDNDAKNHSDEENSNAKSKNWKNDPLLRGKLSGTDSESDTEGIVEGDNILSEKTRRKMEKLEKRMLNRDTIKLKEECPSVTQSKSEINSDKDVCVSSDDDIYNTKRGKQNEIIINTDTDSDIEFISEIRKRTPVKSSKKKNAVCIVSDDENGSGTKSENESDSAGKKKRRRNIRAILSDETLEEETKKANLIEKQRKDRLTQKHKDMDSYLSQSTQMSQEEGFVLDVDEETKAPSVIVHANLTKRLKKHQLAGVKFMWESCYEGVKQLQKDSGSGCILAHCMGLGKTFQVVTLIHTLFSHNITKTKHVVVVCPLSLVLNWKSEFEKGLDGVDNGVDIKLFCLSERNCSVKQKLYVVEKWRQNTGVLIMGYETYQRLTKFQDPENLTLQEKNIKKTLVDPGPDLVVLDEGHLIKNGKNYRTKALMKVETRRRIILTGTPLQNNLREYYYMVQFVKPNLLGSYQEYTNRFVNPITNGQYDDSTVTDIVQMKKRSHVLHKLLKATIQRYEVSELRPYLPEKFDYVLFIQLHPVQVLLYEKYISLLKMGENVVKGKLFSNYTKLQRIWTHPYLLYLQEQENKNVQQPKKNTADGVVASCSTTNVNLDTLNVDNIHAGWWHSLCPDDYRTNIDYGPKFKVMLSIVQECEKVEDKVLIFSGCLNELNAIEFFLQQHETPSSQWKPNLDFYRMDGNVLPDTRLQLCNSFNDKNNKRARVFLITHKVGGLGLSLVAANRVILMDVSWNPALDSQSVFRIYRFGQEKRCYIYRLVSMGTTEEVVYERQVTKLAIAGRVVDEMQISRHYKSNDLQKMYRVSFQLNQERPPLHVPADTILATILQSHSEIFKYHEHQALLENLPEEELNEDEMKTAWDEFNRENERLRYQLNEQQKKRAAMQAGQPGTSGVNTFLPKNFNNAAATPTAEMLRTVQFLQQNNVSIDPSSLANTLPPTNAVNSQSKKQPEVRFEQVFIPDNNKQAFNAKENTSSHNNQKIKNNAVGSNTETELKKIFFDRRRGNVSVGTTSTSTDCPTVPVISNVTGAFSPQSNVPTIPIITNVTGGVSHQNRTPIVPIITKPTGGVSHQNRTPAVPIITKPTGGASKNRTPTVPKITNVTGGASYQNRTSRVPIITNPTGGASNNDTPTVPIITNVTGGASHQKSTPTIPIITNVTGGASKNRTPTVPKITNVTGGASYQNRTSRVPIITNPTGGASNNDTPTVPIITNVTGGASHQKSTPTIPIITNVTGGASHQKSTPTIPIITNVTGGASHQKSTPTIPIITNVTGGASHQNRTPAVRIITNPTGGASKNCRLPIITNVTGGAFHQKSTPTIPIITNVTGGASRQNSTLTTSKTINVPDTARFHNRKSLVPNTTTAPKVSLSKTSTPAPKKIAKAGLPFTHQANNITLTKVVNKGRKEKRSSLVVNPSNSNNAITLTKHTGKQQRNDDIISIQDDVLPNTVLDKTDNNAPFREKQEVLKTLRQNGNISLSPVSRPFVDTNKSGSDVVGQRNSTMRRDDVIEID